MIIARFAPAGRSVVSLGAGAAHRRKRDFLPWSALAGLAWAGYSVGLGYYGGRWLGSTWFGTAVSVLALFAAGALAAFMVKRRRPATGSGPEAATAGGPAVREADIPAPGPGHASVPPSTAVAPAAAAALPLVPVPTPYPGPVPWASRPPPADGTRPPASRLPGAAGQSDSRCQSRAAAPRTTRPSSSFIVEAVISSTAWSNTSRLCAAGARNPETLRTYWRAAALMSSSVASSGRAGGRSVLMLRHMSPVWTAPLTTDTGHRREHR